MKPFVAAIAVLAVFALPASAQHVKLEISDGRVTLDAVNATARQILAEWARIGGTNIVGADKVTGGGLTLKFVGMPERQALDIILRNVAGFIAAPRQAQATAGSSTYDRILIMATSANAAQAASAPRPGMPGGGNALNGTQRRVPGVPPRPPNLPTPDEDDADDPPDTADTGVAPVFTFPGPAGQAPGANNPVFVPMQNSFGNPPGSGNANGNQPPVISLQPGPNGPTIYNFVPNGQTTPAPAPSNAPFSVIGSPTPGMIQVPPQPAPGTQKPPR